MKKINLLFVFIFLLFISTLLFYACSQLTVKASKNYRTETREINHFNSVDAGNVFSVEYTQSSEGSNMAEIYAPENLFEYIELTSTGGKLKAGLKNGINFMGNSDLKIVLRVSSTDLKSVKMSGASRFEAKDELKVGKLTLKASGASKIDLASVEADELAVDISGASHVDLNGHITAQKAFSTSVSGAAECHTGSINAETFTAEVTGASDLDVRFVKCENLEVKASGASDATLRGEAGSATFRASGASTIDATGLKVNQIKSYNSGAATINTGH